MKYVVRWIDFKRVSDDEQIYVIKEPLKFMRIINVIKVYYNAGNMRCLCLLEKNWGEEK